MIDSRKLLERLLGVKRGEVRDEFDGEVYRLATLFTDQKMPIAQALKTVDEKFLREDLTPFMYAVQIAAAVLAMQHLGHLTAKQAEDLYRFLLGLTDMDYETFRAYYRHEVEL